MRRLIVGLLVVLAIASISVSASAKKKHVDTTASFVPGTEVALDTIGNVSLVSFTGNAYALWGARWCFDETDVSVTAQFLPVVWGDNFDPAPTQGTVGPFDTAGVRCETYVWLFPDIYTPVSNIVMEP